MYKFHMGFIYMLNLALQSDSDSVCFQPAKDLKVQTCGQVESSSTEEIFRRDIICDGKHTTVWQ